MEFTQAMQRAGQLMGSSHTITSSSRVEGMRDCGSGGCSRVDDGRRGERVGGEAAFYPRCGCHDCALPGHQRRRWE